MASKCGRDKAREAGAESAVLSQGAVAVLLDVSEGTVKRLCEADGLPHYLVGSRRKFDRAEVVKWLEGRRRVVQAPAVAEAATARAMPRPASDYDAEIRAMQAWRLPSK